VTRGGGRTGVSICASVLTVALVTLFGGCSDRGVAHTAESTTTSTVVTTTTTTEPSTRAVGSLAPADRHRRLTVAVSGDVLVHRAVWESAAVHAGGEGYDFTPMFAELAPLLTAADLAICHLEVPLSADNTDLSSYPRFNAPFQLADALAWAGFDGCSVASNHVLDQGVAGIEATLGHLDRAGLGHAGAARSPDEALAITQYGIRGVQVAHLSYTYGFNGLRPPVGEAWRSNLIDLAAITDEAARARAQGADLIVLSIHWGDEYVHEPNRQQRDVAAALAERADLDLVVGHHAHVVQPVARVGGLPILYGLGNVLSNMLQPERRDGVVVIATFEAPTGGSFELVDLAALPTWVTVPGHRVVSAPTESMARTLGHLGAAGMSVTPIEPGGVQQ
jgi:poly-gamma-glutamate capsule biosynthesis protein CapA/YwtB (metallophosphatase superfamily)